MHNNVEIVPYHRKKGPSQLRYTRHALLQTIRVDESKRDKRRFVIKKTKKKNNQERSEEKKFIEFITCDELKITLKGDSVIP